MKVKDLRVWLADKNSEADVVIVDKAGRIDPELGYDGNGGAHGFATKRVYIIHNEEKRLP